MNDNRQMIQKSGPGHLTASAVDFLQSRAVAVAVAVAVGDGQVNHPDYWLNKNLASLSLFSLLFLCFENRSEDAIRRSAQCGSQVREVILSRDH